MKKTTSKNLEGIFKVIGEISRYCTALETDERDSSENQQTTQNDTCRWKMDGIICIEKEKKKKNLKKLKKKENGWDKD